MRNIKIKFVLAAIAIACSSAAYSQNTAEAEENAALTEQAGEERVKPAKKTLQLPKAGDFGIGVDLVPVFRYVGNFFNGTTYNSFNSFGGSPTLVNDVINPNVSIMGRYMLTNHWAVRVNIGIIADVVQDAYYVRDDAAYAVDPMSQAKVSDSRTMSKVGGSIALGMQYRFGKKRVQGYGGADLIYGVGSYNEEYTYGNALTEINQSPSRHDWGNDVTLPSQWSDAYVLESANVNGLASHVFGLGLNVGMEIFLTSYMSLGGEISFTFLGTYVPQQYKVLEGYNTYSNSVDSWTEVVSPATMSFHCGTENLGGKLYMMFYF